MHTLLSRSGRRLSSSDRADPQASAQLPEWPVHCLVTLILFLLQQGRGARWRRSRPVHPWWRERPDLPAGSVQALAASIRGPFGRSIASMCRRHGIGPGHPDWPALSRAIVAFGGSLKGFRTGAPALGLHWWENPNIVPGMSRGSAPPPPRPRGCCSFRMLRMLRRRRRTPCGPKQRMPGCLRHGWPHQCGRFSLAPVRVSTGPPRCPGLPFFSCLMHGAGAWPAPPS